MFLRNAVRTAAACLLLSCVVACTLESSDGLETNDATELADQATQPLTQEAKHPERRGVGLLPRGNANARGASLVSPPVGIEPRSSLAITDEVLLQGFGFQRVMNLLVTQNNGRGPELVPRTTAEGLFDTLWSTQASECSDGAMNGFPYSCRAREVDANIAGNPFSSGDDGYLPIGLFNRFDLAATDGADCGEYRVVFARRSGMTNGVQRALLIFEAVLANPQPQLGLEGCGPVLTFWQKLSQPLSVARKASLLEEFYFKGLPGFQPVVHMDNYGVRTHASGQVRTNQFMQLNWNLREFKLARSCVCTTDCPPANVCTLSFEPTTVKTNPAERLFRSNATPGVDPVAADFRQSALLPALSSDKLLLDDMNRFGWTVPDEFNSGESDAQNSQHDYASQPSSLLLGEVQSRLDAVGSPLNPTQVLNRATAMSCAGCHQHSNGADLGFGDGVTWPISLGFVHVAEFGENSDLGGQRFLISNALVELFLPHRERVFEDYLNGGQVETALARWATRQGVMVAGQRLLTGDFNRDGKSDVAKVYGVNGMIQIEVYSAGAGAFALGTWSSNRGGWSPSQNWLTGDFDGDGRKDLAKTWGESPSALVPLTTSIDVHLSTGFDFAMRRWATQSGAYTSVSKWLSGDFDGDGKSDVARVSHDNQGMIVIDVYRSTGASFAAPVRWATQQGGFWEAQRWVAGDFNADGRDDLAKVWDDGGLADIDVHESTGSAFTFARRATRQGTFHASQKWVAADFNGDGRADFGKVFGDNGAISIDAYLSSGTSFQVTRATTRWGGFSDAQTWFAGDMNGDGRADYINVFDGAGLVNIDVHVAQ
jgi:hypothetical protein